MPIATKNGNLIVKNGLLSQNCECCKQYCCPGSVGEFTGGTATLRVTRQLNVIANSACACRFPFPPPSTATLCFDESGVFSQASSSQCLRTLTGTASSQAYWLPTPVSQGPFTSTIGFLANPCRIYATLDWPYFRCAGNLTGHFYAWEYVPLQATYQATYYVFFFTNFAGNNYAVLNTTGETPTNQPSPYAWGGSRWTVSMELTFA